MQNTFMQPTERYEILLRNVERANNQMETYLAQHIDVPEDIQERYDKAVQYASDYAVVWGFEFDIDTYDA
jgi:hypothetical protein